MEMKYYGRDGKAITLEEWSALLERIDGRRVAKTEVVTPGGQTILVSTVLIGLDMNYGDGPPIIFETMTFDESPGADDDDRWRDIETRRYSTEVEALQGHAEIVGWLEAFGYQPVEEEDPIRRAMLQREARASVALDGGTFAVPGPEDPDDDA